jgi:hypothetical protein
MLHRLRLRQAVWQALSEASRLLRALERKNVEMLLPASLLVLVLVSSGLHKDMFRCGQINSSDRQLHVQSHWHACAYDVWINTLLSELEMICS